MRFQLLLACFLVISTNSFSQNQPLPKYPPYETVVRKFITEYGYHKRKDGSWIDFEKRPEGWFVARFRFPDYALPFRSEIFWSAKTAGWHRFDLQKEDFGEKNTDKAVQEFFKEKGANSRWYFERSICYGYKGFTTDVIRLLQNQPNLNDTLRFSLANAWLERTINLVHRQFNYGDSAFILPLQPGKNAMTPQQLDTYFQSATETIRQYDTLARQYPAFETFVGEAPVKYANTVMHAFLNLQYLQDEKTAFEFTRPYFPLPYTDFILEYSRNMLENCPKNAVLCTWGDNDTYPLLYVQAAENVRPDVMVFNLSLAGLGRYVNHFRGKVFGAKGLKMSLPAQFYEDDLSDYIYLKPYSDSIGYWADLLRVMQSPKRKMQHEHIDTEVSRIWFRSIAAPESGKPPIRVGWDLKEKSILTRSDLALMDILNANWNDRPVCLACTVNSSSFEGIRPNFRLEGLIYRFHQTPLHEDFPQSFSGSLDEELTFQNLLKRNARFSKSKIGAAGRPTAMSESFILLMLGRRLLASGDTSRAKEVVNFIFEKYPNERFPHNNFQVYWANFDVELGEKERPISVCHQILDNYEKGVVEADDFESAKESIRRIAEKLEDAGLLKRLEKK